MSHILTYTGVEMDPTQPKSSDFVLEDIAHALSLMTRANGHFETFYSVAQHCIGCAQEAKARGYSERLQLACLLHDAAEAYISDITRPVKENLPKYKDYENVLLDMIWEKFLGSPLTEEERALVFDIDDIMLYHEFKHFTNYELFEPKSVLLTKDTQNYDFVDFKLVEKEYESIGTVLIDSLHK